MVFVDTGVARRTLDRHGEKVAAHGQQQGVAPGREGEVDPSQGVHDPRRRADGDEARRGAPTIVGDDDLELMEPLGRQVDGPQPSALLERDRARPERRPVHIVV